MRLCFFCACRKAAGLVFILRDGMRRMVQEERPPRFPCFLAELYTNFIFFLLCS